MNEEGKMIAERLRYLDAKIRDARVLSDEVCVDEFTKLQKIAASEAIQYCKKTATSYWDFLKEVGI